MFVRENRRYGQRTVKQFGRCDARQNSDPLDGLIASADRRNPRQDHLIRGT